MHPALNKTKIICTIGPACDNPGTLGAMLLAGMNVARWITAFSARESTCQKLAFSYGVHPVKVEDEQQDWVPFSRAWLKQNNLKEGIAVLSQGPSPEHPLASHRMEVLDIGLDTSIDT